jgi:hypothetical protein
MEAAQKRLLGPLANNWKILEFEDRRKSSKNIDDICLLFCLLIILCIYRSKIVNGVFIFLHIFTVAYLFIGNF